MEKVEQNLRSLTEDTTKFYDGLKPLCDSPER